MLMLDAVDHYLAEADLMTASVETYKPNLRAYAYWIYETAERAATLDDLNPDMFKQFMHYLKTKETIRGRIGCRPRTIKSQFSALRGLCNWLIKQGLMTTNPVSQIKLPRLDRADRIVLSEDEVKAVLRATRFLIPARNRALASAMIHVYACCALRKSELLNLRVRDIDLDQKKLIVDHGKGDLRRVVPISPECLVALSAWMKERDALQPRHDYLWAITVSRPMGDEGLCELLRNLAVAAELKNPERCVSHAFRRAAASHWLRCGVTVKTIQELMGHSDMQTTMFYLFTGEAEMRHATETSGWLTEEAPAKPPDKPVQETQTALPAPPAPPAPETPKLEAPRVPVSSPKTTTPRPTSQTAQPQVMRLLLPKGRRKAGVSVTIPLPVKPEPEQVYLRPRRQR